MSKRSVCWINVSQIPTNSQRWSIIAIFIPLVVGSLAVAFRVYLCQAQAYAIILLTIIAISTMLLHTSQRRESIVKIKKEVYCADLSQTSHIAVTPGRLSRAVVSSYEQLYFSRVRVWLPLIVWLVWVAYGSLFHSGEHNDDIHNALLVDLTNVGADTPKALRLARLYLLAFCALGSMCVTQYFRRRESREPESTIVKMSEAEQRWQCRFWFLFGVLLFFPAQESTAQALLPTRLLARTGFFFVLFILSESLNRLVHYERWIRCYHSFTQAILVAVQISLGKAKTMPLKEDRTKELVKCIDKMEPPPPVLEPRKQNSPDLLTSEIVKYCAVLQSSWILFASEAVYPVALFQVVLLLVMNKRLRNSIVDLVNERAEFFLVNQDPLTQQLPVTSKNNFRNAVVLARSPPEAKKDDTCLPPPPTSVSSRHRAPSQIDRPVSSPKPSVKDAPERGRSESTPIPMILKSSSIDPLPKVVVRQTPVPRTLSIPRSTPHQPQRAPSPPPPPPPPVPDSTSDDISTTTSVSPPRPRMSDNQVRRAALARLEAPAMDARN